MTMMKNNNRSERNNSIFNLYYTDFPLDFQNIQFHVRLTIFV